ncbi:MAG: 30S ribosome-binding factor RbfA [Eubacterium sp.]|nr:30S ribosome-binding factor RbfA [Eubacterium sp.]
MTNFNIDRVSEDIKREISVAIRDIKDPRVAGKLVSITQCMLTNDLSYCKLYVSCMGSEAKTDKAVAALTDASGFFKRRINQRIKLRKLPELIFLPDNSLDYYEHIEKVIEGLPKAEEDKAE